MSSPNDSDDWLFQQLTNVRAALQAAFVARPFDQYIIPPGNPPWDCAHLAVWSINTRHAGKATAAKSATEPIARAVVNVVTIQIEAIRCVTVFEHDNFPGESVITDDGEAIETDKWVIWRTLTRATIDGTLFGGCTSTFMRPQQSLDQQGGYAGSRTIIEVTV